MIAAAVGIIATLLPWFTASAGAFGYSISNSINGFHGAGAAYFLLVLVNGALAFIGDRQDTLPKNMRLAAIGCSAVAFICLVIAYANANENASRGFGLVDLNIGIGYILAVLSGGALVIIPFVIKKPGESLGNDFAGLKDSVKAAQENMADNAAAKRAAKVEELEKLIAMRNEGRITQQEYEAFKARIM